MPLGAFAAQEMRSVLKRAAQDSRGIGSSAMLNGAHGTRRVRGFFHTKVEEFDDRQVIAKGWFLVGWGYRTEDLGFNTTKDSEQWLWLEVTGELYRVWQEVINEYGPVRWTTTYEKNPAYDDEIYDHLLSTPQQMQRSSRMVERIRNGQGS